MRGKQPTFQSAYMMDINSELYATPKNILKQTKSFQPESQLISEEYPILQDTMSKYQALFVASNLLLGVGTLIIPNTYLSAGALFSTLFLLFMALIAYTSGEYVVEAIGICNYITKHKNEDIDLYINQLGNSTNHIDIEDNNTIHNQNSKIRKEIKKKFHMDLKFELGEISGLLWGKEAQVIISMAVIIYLIGGTIAKTISISRLLKNAFSDVYLLDNFFFWIGLIFLFSSLFSFKNISSFAWISEYIAIIRLFAIYSMIMGCAYEVYKTGYKGIAFEPEFPLVNLNNFQCLFSNIILAFSFHHSIPAFVKPIAPQRDVKWVMRATFMLGFIIFLSLSYCGVSAFGKNIINLKDVHFISDNFKSREIIVYYISAFYLFLTVIAFPVFVITCRNNLMKLIVPSKIPQISSEITPYTFIFTIAILFTIIIFSSIANNIQLVLNFICGTLGVLIVFIAPPLFVIQGRQILEKEYKVNYKLNRYCASFSNIYLPWAILVLGVSGFIYNSYNLTK